MITKCQFRNASFFMCLGMLFCVNAKAQTPAKDQKTTEDPCKKPSDSSKVADWEKSHDQSVVICKFDLQSFEPTIGGRIARSFQYQYQIGEQFRTVVAGSGSTAQFLQNPEHYLNQHSLKFQFSELFWSTSDLDSAIQQIIAERPTLAGKPVQLQMCNPKIEVVRCLASGESLWKRAFSGLTLTASLSERQGVQLGTGFAPEGSFADHYGVTGQIDFDPTTMFVNATSWKEAAGAIQKIEIVPPMSKNLDDDQQGCFFQKTNWNHQQEDRCIQRLSKATSRASANRGARDDLFELMIPTFQFKRLSQFDFVKSGIVLVPAKFPESALNNYSLTWDFRRVIATRAFRNAAHGAFNSYKPYGDDGATSSKSKKVCVTDGTSPNFIVVEDPFTPELCLGLANSIGAELYALGCTHGSGVKSSRAVSARLKESADFPDENECKWVK